MAETLQQILAKGKVTPSGTASPSGSSNPALQAILAKGKVTSAPIQKSVGSSTTQPQNSSLASKFFGPQQPVTINPLNVVKDVATTYKNLPGDVANDIKSGADTMDKGGVINWLKGAAKAGVGTTGDVAGAFFSPVSATINEGLKATGVQSAMDGISDVIADKISDIPEVQKFAMKYPNAGSDFGKAMNVIMGVAGGNEEINPVESMKGAIDTGKTGVENVKNVASSVKESIKPSLTPIEATGQIIQGDRSDIPKSQRTLGLLKDISNIKTQADLSKAINEQIIKPTLKLVDDEFDKDTSGGHSIKSFEKNIGDGKNSVKINYVRQGIDQLRDFYKKTNDAQGLSDMSKLENKSKINGLTYKDINNLARRHGSDINAFNANGEASSGLTKQAAENTRSGLKETAREGLGTPQAKAFDKIVTEAIKTKELVDDQAEKINKSLQKSTKVGELPKKLSSVAKAIIHPKDFLSGFFGVAGKGETLSPLDIQANIQDNLKTILKNK